MQAEDAVKKWISFFYVLDADRNGILDVQDIELIIQRLIGSRPGLFSKMEGAYLRVQILKNFDRLLMEAGSGKERNISLLDWVRMIKRANKTHKKTHFLRWFSASAVRFLFDLGDHNRDGYIDFDEFETIYKVLGLNRGSIINAFKELDQNRDGRLSKVEMYTAISHFFSDALPANRSALFGEIEKLSSPYIEKLLVV